MTSQVLQQPHYRTNSTAKLQQTNSNQSRASIMTTSTGAERHQQQQQQQQQQVASSAAGRKYPASSRDNNHLSWPKLIDGHERTGELRPKQDRGLKNSIDDEEEEDDDDDHDHNQDDEDEVEGGGEDLDKENQNEIDDQNKPHGHVGPVMGIFFKVWSLVKVTKVRHHNQKMRRQNSEDAGQFHYISGDQLAASSGPANTASAGATNNTSNNNRRSLHLLQDGHFRRAGSQPAPSSSMSSAELATPISCASASSSTSSSGPAPVAVAAAAAAATSLTVTAHASNTNSSSSGVSSATSNNLAALADRHLPNTSSTTTTTTTPSKGAQSSSQSARKSVRKMARENKQAAFDAASRSNYYNQHQQQQPPAAADQQATTSKSTWTSKIKRSATTVNQSDLGSYVSRYRFRRPNNSGQPLFGLSSRAAEASHCTPPQAAAGGSYLRRDVRAKSEQAGRGSDELQKKWARARLMSRDAISVHEDDNMHANNDNDDSDLNDIYSTPNDSIHSVPNSAPITGAEQATSSMNNYFGDNFNSSATNLNQQQQQQQQPPNVMNRNHHAMTKSFSANNFSHLIRHQDTRNYINYQIDTIQEHHQFQTNDSQARTAVKDDHNNSQRLLSSSTANNSNNFNDDNDNINQSKRLSGSRFFISSSSSEDSNPPSQPNSHQMTSRPQQQQQQQSSSSAQQQQQQQRLNTATNIPINFGLHYHQEPIANNNQLLLPVRPNSLLIAGQSLASNSNFVHLPASGPLATPTFAPAGCAPDSVAIAAMSPAAVNAPPMLPASAQVVRLAGSYKKSPSLFEISTNNNNYSNRTTNQATATTRFSSRFPQQHQPPLTSTFQCKPPQQQQQFMKLHRNGSLVANNNNKNREVPNSISLHDCKLSSAMADGGGQQTAPAIRLNNQQPERADLYITGNEGHDDETELDSFKSSEYKLTQMLLELGSNSGAKDQLGCTALMHAVMSDNLPALKCLIEHGVDLDDTNLAGLSALDLICAKRPNELRLEMLKLLIDSRVDMDKTRETDGSRLLDRLIAEHGHLLADKLAYIDCLLHNGAKLGSSTWAAASGKHEIQLRLLRKLCQDGYFLYKKSSIEPAVYRFEYALKRIAELEQQLANGCCARSGAHLNLDQSTLRATQQIKYQTYLGLSRCERKRKFFKRALEFAHMSILVDSTAYEGYYSKAHILKDLGEFDESLTVINQTDRLVEKSIETIKSDLNDLQHQEDSIIFDGCFNMRDPNRSCWIEATRTELVGNLDYLEEAKKHISRLRGEIMDDKSSLTTT